MRWNTLMTLGIRLFYCAYAQPPSSRYFSSDGLGIGNTNSPMAAISSTHQRMGCWLGIVT